MGQCFKIADGEESYFVSLAVQVRNLHEGEQTALPPTLLDTGMPYLVFGSTHRDMIGSAAFKHPCGARSSSQLKAERSNTDLCTQLLP